MDSPLIVTPLGLDGRASGLRHLRWAREAIGTLEGHLAEALPDPKLRENLDAALATVSLATAELSAAVRAYRDFLERVRTRVRGRVRAGAVWGVDRTAELDACDRDEREPLRRRVREQVARLRASVERALRQLEGWPAVQASVLPPLADPLRVGDAPDDDDDASASADGLTS